VYKQIIRIVEINKKLRREQGKKGKKSERGEEDYGYATLT